MHLTSISQKIKEITKKNILYDILPTLIFMIIYIFSIILEILYLNSLFFSAILFNIKERGLQIERREKSRDNISGLCFHF